MAFLKRRKPRFSTKRRPTLAEAQQRAKARRDVFIEDEIQGLMKSDPDIKLQIIGAYLQRDLIPGKPEDVVARQVQKQMYDILMKRIASNPDTAEPFMNQLMAKLMGLEVPEAVPENGDGDYYRDEPESLLDRIRELKEIQTELGGGNGGGGGIGAGFIEFMKSDFMAEIGKSLGGAIAGMLPGARGALPAPAAPLQITAPAPPAPETPVDRRIVVMVDGEYVEMSEVEYRRKLVEGTAPPVRTMTREEAGLDEEEGEDEDDGAAAPEVILDEEVSAVAAEESTPATASDPVVAAGPVVLVPDKVKKMLADVTPAELNELINKPPKKLAEKVFAKAAKDKDLAEFLPLFLSASPGLIAGYIAPFQFDPDYGSAIRYIISEPGRGWLAGVQVEVMSLQAAAAKRVVEEKQAATKRNRRR